MKKQDQQQTLPRIVGVDAHSEKLVLCILQPALNGRSRDAVKLKTINCEVDRLEETFKKQTLPNDEIILEASTNSFSIVSRLKKIHRCATVIKSESVCGMSRKDKINDAVDAENIARFWLTGTAETVWAPDETTGIYRDILFGYRNATKDKVRASNRIWAFCSAHGFRLPARSRKQKVEAVRKQVLEFNWDKTMRFFIENLLKDYEHFCDLRNSFLQKIYEIVSTNESMLRAMEILGIRAIGAFAVVAFVGDISRFASAKKLVAYIGLNPSVCESGKYKNIRRTSPFGIRLLKSILVECAQSAFRTGKSNAHRWARKLSIFKGYQKAIVALARKMVCYLFHALRGDPCPNLETPQGYETKLQKIASCLGKSTLKSRGFATQRDWIDSILATRNLSTSFSPLKKILPIS